MDFLFTKPAAVSLQENLQLQEEGFSWAKVLPEDCGFYSQAEVNVMLPAKISTKKKLKSKTFQNIVIILSVQCSIKV